MAHAILVIDDDADFTDLLHEVLSARGHRVEVALDATSATERVQSLRPDYIILDLGLGSADGLDLAPQLRSASSKPFRLVAVTGWSDDKTKQAARAAGFDVFLPKPLDLQKLDDVLGVNETNT